MTADQYRQKWKLPSDYPMVAPDIPLRGLRSRKKSDLVGRLRAPQAEGRDRRPGRGGESCFAGMRDCWPIGSLKDVHRVGCMPSIDPQAPKAHMAGTGRVPRPHWRQRPRNASLSHESGGIESSRGSKTEVIRVGRTDQIRLLTQRRLRHIDVT